ncbi:hypothetical protein [Paenibacillus jamilae]|uniref:hypothetical protein n=1 Tax=Paenibacillus TaxID=44249 RepID=UPI00216B2331|nr:hypothetical protein [Paenibacillus jamilae]
MPANVETMFYTREAPWHGLGNRVENAITSDEALQKAGRDWNVIQKSILTDTLMEIPGFKPTSETQTIRYSVLSLTATKSSRITRHSHLPTIC